MTGLLWKLFLINTINYNGQAVVVSSHKPLVTSLAYLYYRHYKAAVTNPVTQHDGQVALWCSGNVITLSSDTLRGDPHDIHPLITYPHTPPLSHIHSFPPSPPL